MRISISARQRTSLIVVAVLAVAGLGVFGLTRPGPEAAAGALAEGLSSLDMSGVPFVDMTASEAGQQLSIVVGGMDGLRPAVRVQDVRESGDTATAVLELIWDVDETDADWTYTTTAALTREDDGDDDAWRVQWSPALIEPSLQAEERLVLQELPAERGDIRGAGGQVLVTERPVVRVGIDKTKVTPEDADDSARRLAEQLSDVDASAFVARVEAAGPRAFVEALVLRAEDAGLPSVDRARVEAIEGVALIEDELSLAPTREFARPLLGTVGEATAELVDASDGRLRAGDVTGLSGLQQTYDEQLRGRAGRLVQAVPGEGGAERARDLHRRDATAGEPLDTTLDRDLQRAAEDLLSSIESASALVAVRPSTGEVLTAASGPGGDDYSTATLGRYAPGSTFKVVTALALLRSGVAPDSVLSCPRTIVVDGRSFENYDDYPVGALGDIPLRAAVANSCNTALIGASERAPQAALSQAAAGLGLGLDADLGVPSFSGSVPRQAGDTEHAASMIGQGRVEASPLAMAVVAASIAQGETVHPTMLQKGRQKTVRADEPVTSAEAGQLEQMMRAAVTEGSARFLADVPGAPVGAKTGTAEHGTEQPPRTHAWMIGVQDDLAVAVFVEEGDSGSATAGPLLERFLRGAA